MNKFKIAYVDEDDVDIRRFQRFSRNYFDVVPIKPDKQLEITAQEILSSHVDAVIADFDLAEQDESIHYNGANLISYILEQRENYPVFILTSYEDDAVLKGDDVNIVYEKSEMGDGEKFLERVKTQIEKYYHKLDEDEKRLVQLIEESRKRKLNAFEDEEIIKLDSVIERALDKRSTIPDHIRQRKHSDELLEILKKVDDLEKKLGAGDE